jgi:Tfp pilus assembly protein PilF
VDAVSLGAKDEARVWVLRGELAERVGDGASAVDAYERAVALNPRVGVKGRLAQLKASS